MARPCCPRCVVWLALGVSVAAAPASQPSARPADQDLRAWVAQMDDPDPAVRDGAEERLASAGSRAIGVLTEARGDPRPEVAGRALRALRRIRLFTRHGEAEPLDLAAQYMATATRAGRVAVIGQLVQARADPAILVRLFTLEPDAALRSQLLSAVGIGYRRTIGGLVVDDDTDAVNLLLEQALAEQPYVGAADYAVAQFLTGGWDDAVARWRAEWTNGDPDQRKLAAGVLCDLYRVAHHPDDAAEMAARTQDWQQILPAAIDRGDWHAAAGVANGWPTGKGAGMRAALRTLTGWAPGSVLLGLSGEADAAAADPDAVPIGKVHLLLGDVTGGLSRLSAPPNEGGEPVSAFELLRARGDYDGALALATRFEHDGQVGPAMVDARTKLLQLLGELPAPPTAIGSTDRAPEDPHWMAAVTDIAASRFADAAAELAGGDTDPDRIDWHYVRGYALDAAGDHERGQRLMRSAALVPLADVARRLALAQRLDAAGLSRAAAEQRTLAGRAGSPFLEPVAMLNLAIVDRDAAVRRQDWPTAAFVSGRIWLLSFWPDLTWKDPTAYLDVPADVHLTLAQVARLRGDWTTAAREMSTVDALLPLGTTAALTWVPLLDGHGDHAGAEGRFAAVYDRLDALATKYPRSPFLHNQAAWLGACSCRRLDAALAHAQAAVDLTGGADWQYLDTLAECRFRLGDRDAAQTLERRALGLPGGDRVYLDRQLARFQRAEVPSTTRPAVVPE